MHSRRLDAEYKELDMKCRLAHAALGLLGIVGAMALAIPTQAQTLGGATQLGTPQGRAQLRAESATWTRFVGAVGKVLQASEQPV